LSQPNASWLSRRLLLKAVSLAPLAGALPGLLSGCETSQAPARAVAARFFDDHQREVVRAATARLLPGPDDDPAERGHPGAREADVVSYIDGLLAAFAVDPPRLHAGGPFSDRPAGGSDDMAVFVPLPRVQEQAWRTRVQQLQRRYQDGIALLDRLAGGDFTAAAPARQDRVLARAEVEPFLDTLFTHAIEGMYSVPEYGGNAVLSGWLDIGWPGDRQPVGYPPAKVSQPAQADVLHPEGVVAKLLRLLDPSWTGTGGG
jgi:hypothetical protein